MGALENEDKVEKKLKTKTETRYDEETTQLLRCLDYFKLYEIQTSSKTQSMRYPQKNFHSILTDMQ
jgi:predicted ATPase